MSLNESLDIVTVPVSFFLFLFFLFWRRYPPQIRSLAREIIVDICDPL